jgi:cyclophilin family peptidyl-prolyl cis-trans isomerase
MLIWLLALFFAQTPVPQQAVVQTTKGSFVIALQPEKAPNHVAFFIRQARAGAYNGTLFHRVIRYGIIQGGDPLSKDPTKLSQFGTGGMNQLKAEFTDDNYVAGTVAAVLLPGKPDSAGPQFFVCVTDQKGLVGHYTIFGHVVEGIEVVQEISAVPANANGLPTERVAIESVTIRDAPPPPVVPFSTETAAELAAYRVVLQTTKGDITLKVRPDLAPATVRDFLRMSEAGVYDNTLFHRVVKDFVIQTGSPAHRSRPLTSTQAALVHNLPPEFTPTPNLPGVVSMARGEALDSATSSYTVFAEVESGMDVVKAIEAVAVNGEAPVDPVGVMKAIVRKAG